MMDQALGLIEVIGLIPAVEGADSALKAANVTLLGLSKVGADIVTVALIGDVGAIHAAVEAGAASAARVGHLRTTDIIARLDPQVRGLFLTNLMPKAIIQPSKEEAKPKEVTIHQRISHLLSTIHVDEPTITTIAHQTVAPQPEPLPSLAAKSPLLEENIPLSAQLTMSAEPENPPTIAKKPRRPRSTKE